MALHAYQADGGSPVEEVTANKTLDQADSGVPQVVTADAVVVTLPATVAGLTYVIVNGSNRQGDVGVTVSPNASDQIIGNGFTAADDKDAINTKATARPGDKLVLVGDGVDGWFVQEVKGTWVREA